MLAACTSSNDVELLRDPVRYRLDLLFMESEPGPANLRAFIDGAERSSLEFDVALAELTDTEHLVELILDNETIRALPIAIDSFGRSCQSDSTRTITQAVCVYGSGDLRFGSETVDGSCTVDAACRPTCMPQRGCLGARCTSLVTSQNPLSSHLGCAPIGPKFVGQACSLTPTPDGAYDDCGQGMLCVEGRCHLTCGTEGDCTGCANVPGHAIEMKACPLT